MEEELRAFSEQTLQGLKEKSGLLCMPGMQEQGAIWIDTLFAVTPFMLFSGLSLHESRYVDFAVDQCLRMIEALRDTSCGLLYQCRGYVGEGIEELTPTIVNKFVKKIIVHEAKHSNGKRVQQIEIIYNFISELDFPQLNQPITVAKGFNEKIA